MTYAVRFEDVTKRYPRGGPRYASLRHDLVGGIRRLSSRLAGHRPEPRGTLALDGVSFEVAEGESFALIGPNGAGKTTALKLISRISYPSGGLVRVRGRVAALIEVGSGVHPELTAHENILLYGRILGMGKSEVRRRFDEIVEFAEIADFLDTPVKMYSSGMQLRLGFSIASHLDPDIFVVDEALAVGDAGFQAKCVDRMTKLVREGRTLLFVSHNLPAVEALCTQGALLLDGRVMSSGTARSVLTDYLQWVDSRSRYRLASSGNGVLDLSATSCHDLSGDERYAFPEGSGLELRLVFKGKSSVRRPHVNIAVTDGSLHPLITISMLSDGQAPNLVGPRWECRCRIESLPLRPRLYRVFADVYDETGGAQLMEWREVTGFRIERSPTVTAVQRGPLHLVQSMAGGAVRVPYQWKVRNLMLPAD